LQKQIEGPFEFGQANGIIFHTRRDYIGDAAE
jgi:hypothetical protein